MEDVDRENWNSSGNEQWEIDSFGNFKYVMSHNDIFVLSFTCP